MLAARGVSLGLGKINLSELNQLPLADRATLGRMAKAKKKRESVQPKYIVKKKVDKQTLFAACKAVIFGAIFITAGFAMTVLGYFDKELATEIIYNSTLETNTTQMDDKKRYFFKSMQYIGPILMGFGSISLIVACVMTLESRDKHAQIIQEESNEFRKTRIEKESTKTSLLSPFEETIEIEEESPPKTLETNPNQTEPLSSSIQPTELDVHKFLNVNTRKPKGPAPIAEADSIVDLHSVPLLPSQSSN